MSERICFNCGTKYRSEENEAEHLCSDCRVKRKQRPLDNKARTQREIVRLEGSWLVKVVKTGVFLFGTCFFSPFIIMLIGSLFGG